MSVARIPEEQVVDEQPTVDKSAEAKALIEKEKNERVERVGQGIKELLEKENCDLDISVIVTTRGNIPQLNIVAKE